MANLKGLALKIKQGIAVMLGMSHPHIGTPHQLTVTGVNDSDDSIKPKFAQTRRCHSKNSTSSNAIDKIQRDFAKLVDTPEFHETRVRNMRLRSYHKVQAN